MYVYSLYTTLNSETFTFWYLSLNPRVKKNCINAQYVFLRIFAWYTFIFRMISEIYLLFKSILILIIKSLFKSNNVITPWRAASVQCLESSHSISRWHHTSPTIRPLKTNPNQLRPSQTTHIKKIIFKHI